MSKGEGKMLFYGIRYSESLSEEDEASIPRVLPFEGSLLKELLSKHKALKPRFKVFHSQEEALAFAKVESPDNLSSECPKKAPSGNAECPFPSLTPQELAAFRKDIKSSDIQAVSQKIMSNPRYLVSLSTDTPSIIHSGTRSNPLHTIAEVGDPALLNLVLDTLERQDFLESLYPKESEEFRKQRGDHLLDNYINLPQKGNNETPLHIASKFGHLTIIKILVSYSQCFINPLNKYGYTPEAIACSRAPDGTARKSLIIEAIKGRVYIPIYRSLEYGGSIGEPWSPSTPSKRLFDTSDFSPMKSPYRSPYKKSPLVILPSVNKDNYSLCDGPKRVSGLLGPISPIEAPKLKKEWKMSGSKSRLNDPNRGFEKQGREIARKYGIDWREYWEFLDAYVDFSSKEGLIALEDYLEDTAHQVGSNKNDFSDSYRVDNLSYGFEELEIGGESSEKVEEGQDEIKSPISSLLDDFQGLSLSSPTKSVRRNPLITHFNRNIKREKQSFHAEVNSHLSNISDQILYSYNDHEDDKMDDHHFLMSVFSLPLSVFKRKLNQWRVDNRPFYCDESTLLENLCAKVCDNLSQELQKEDISDFIESLKRFSSSPQPPSAVPSLKEEFNGSYRSASNEEDEPNKGKEYASTRDEVLFFVERVLNCFDNTKSKDSNANDLSLLPEDKHLTQTKDLFQNLSLEEENDIDTCSESSFRTAESESDRESFETAVAGNKEFYIYGKEPSQTDLEVYLALSGVDTSEFPFISLWRAYIEEYDLASRGAWPTKTKNLEESLNISKFDLDLSLDYSSG